MVPAWGARGSRSVGARCLQRWLSLRFSATHCVIFQTVWFRAIRNTGCGLQVFNLHDFQCMLRIARFPFDIRKVRKASFELQGSDCKLSRWHSHVSKNKLRAASFEMQGFQLKFRNTRILMWSLGVRVHLFAMCVAFVDERQQFARLALSCQRPSVPTRFLLKAMVLPMRPRTCTCRAVLVL